MLLETTNYDSLFKLEACDYLATLSACPNCATYETEIVARLTTVREKLATQTS